MAELLQFLQAGLLLAASSRHDERIFTLCSPCHETSTAILDLRVPRVAVGFVKKHCVYMHVAAQHQTCIMHVATRTLKMTLCWFEIVLYSIHHVQEYKQQKALLWHLSLAPSLFSVTSPYRHTYLQSLRLIQYLPNTTRLSDPAARRFYTIPTAAEEVQRIVLSLEGLCSERPFPKYLVVWRWSGCTIY